MRRSSLPGTADPRESAWPAPDLVLAFGEAALPMLGAALEAYPEVPALAVPPRGTPNLSAPDGAEVLPGSHPVPDEHSTLVAEWALARVREQGYSVDDEERELGVRCVAVPVRDHTRQVATSISVSAPTSRLGRDRIAGVAERLNRAAEQVSVRLGRG